METTHRPILLAQCKAYQSIDEISKAIENLLKTQSTNYFDIYISLPYSFIEPLSKKFEAENIVIGAETLLDTDEGSFTASIVGKMLKEAKAKFVLIGTDQDRTSPPSQSQHSKRKVKAALDANIPPFVCIGETFQEHQDKVAKDILKNQLKDSLEGFSSEELKDLYIVYNVEWIAQTPWEANSPELHEAYTTFKETVNDVLGAEAISSNQLMITVPAYSEELKILVQQLQENSDSPKNFSIGILALSSEFLQPLVPIPAHNPEQTVEENIHVENIPIEEPSQEILQIANKPHEKKDSAQAETQNEL